MTSGVRHKHTFFFAVTHITMLTFAMSSPILGLVETQVIRQQSFYRAALCSSAESIDQEKQVLATPWTPWDRPESIKRMVSKRSRRNKNRCRQHVNPLASQFQKNTVLPDTWPQSNFIDPHKPLHLDIGCGKGGFLMDFAAFNVKPGDSSKTFNYNHLGLEIRPPVVQLAKTRLIERQLQGNVDVIGCNANVDLDRILSLYPGPLQLVSIQFPDPHFKSQHAKRRVVRMELVQCIAKHLVENGSVFLQSDIQPVLDDMRARFADCDEYFVDNQPIGEYLLENPLGVPTEREVSVVERDLPVYRAMFCRNGQKFKYCV
ncbi:hypothetical protein MPSEU_000563100 [Mayamaea pseudoterrestris]|nr:hypothetical protein MPSEU_000563100 [Mayamaea pseudoterrestris]